MSHRWCSSPHNWTAQLTTTHKSLLITKH